MILGDHTAVICVRNARCWDVTVEEGGVDEVTHRIAHTMCLTALLLPFCTRQLCVELRELGTIGRGHPPLQFMLDSHIVVCSMQTVLVSLSTLFDT